MGFLISVLLLTIAKYATSGVHESSVLLLPAPPKLDQSVNQNKSDPIVHNNLNQNRAGLKDLPKLLGKEKLAQIRRNFNLIQNFDMIDLNQIEKPGKLEKTPSRRINIEDQSEEGDQKGKVKLFNDVRLTNISMSVNTSHDNREDRLDITEVHNLSILQNQEKLSDAANQRTQDVLARDDTDSVNKLDFVSKFFIREVKFNCTEGKYYKRGSCNICYCTKGSQWKPCTKVKCAKENVDFSHKMLLKNSKNSSFMKLRAEATGCVPGQRIKTDAHKGKCPCICTLPSVMQCPLCAAVDYIKVKLNDKEKAD